MNAGEGESAIDVSNSVASSEIEVIQENVAALAGSVSPSVSSLASSEIELQENAIIVFTPATEQETNEYYLNIADTWGGLHDCMIQLSNLINNANENGEDYNRFFIDMFDYMRTMATEIVETRPTFDVENFANAWHDHQDYNNQNNEINSLGDDDGSESGRNSSGRYDLDMIGAGSSSPILVDGESAAVVELQAEHNEKIETMVKDMTALQEINTQLVREAEENKRLNERNGKNDESEVIRNLHAEIEQLKKDTEETIRKGLEEQMEIREAKVIAEAEKLANALEDARIERKAAKEAREATERAKTKLAEALKANKLLRNAENGNAGNGNAGNGNAGKKNGGKENAGKKNAEMSKEKHPSEMVNNREFISAICTEFNIDCNKNDNDFQAVLNSIEILFSRQGDQHVWINEIVNFCELVPKCQKYLLDSSIASMEETLKGNKKTSSAMKVVKLNAGQVFEYFYNFRTLSKNNEINATKQALMTEFWIRGGKQTPRRWNMVTFAYLNVVISIVQRLDIR